MHKYIFMGPQGSGKSTQADLLKADFDLVHISVGEIFRWHVTNHTKTAARITRIIDAGQLVPDEVVEEIVASRLQLHDWNYGFILDGFPRNRPQAEFFLESYDIDAVVLLDVPEKIALERIMSRHRSDDTPEAVRGRLADYHSKTKPIIELFSHKELVYRVDAGKGVEEVQREVRERLGFPLNVGSNG
ncbi:Adenylate kinase [Planctomycetes bacterium Pan216]|uniref:Adenylate kinase n=1 Tax=Kolteria novifilia TaxID=2527975 RepID=A0A518B4X2_9BACT|nr:Adenylate kinase [Planctomycetes bacterium Pan216]